MTLLSTNWHKSCCTCVKARGEGRKLRRRIKVDIKIFRTLCFIISDSTSRSFLLIVWKPYSFGLTRCTCAVCMQETMVVTFGKTSIIKHNFHVSLQACLREIGHFFTHHNSWFMKCYPDMRKWKRKIFKVDFFANKGKKVCNQRHFLTHDPSCKKVLNIILLVLGASIWE